MDASLIPGVPRDSEGTPSIRPLGVADELAVIGSDACFRSQGGGDIGGREYVDPPWVGATVINASVAEAGAPLFSVVLQLNF